MRFTKAERELVRALCNGVAKEMPLDVHRLGTARAVVDKLDAASTPKAAKGLPVKTAIEAFREVLGNRLIVLPSYTAAWYAIQANRLAQLGLTRGDCVTVARVAAEEWRGPIKAESLIRQADKLLVSSRGELPLSPTAGDRPIPSMDDL